MTDTPVSTDDFEPDPPADPAPADPPEGNPPADLGDAGKQAIDRMKAERSQARRELTQARARITQLEKANQTDSERAISDAETRGRTSALAEVGVRLARAQFDTMAARRNPAVDTSPIVEYVDMAKFVAEDGEVDDRALQAAVDRLVPEVAAGPPSFDGGVRTPARATNMNEIIRSQALGGRTA